MTPAPHTPSPSMAYATRLFKEGTPVWVAADTAPGIRGYMAISYAGKVVKYKGMGVYYVRDVQRGGQGTPTPVHADSMRERVVQTGGVTLRNDRSITLGGARTVELSAAKVTAAAAMAAAADANAAKEKADTGAKLARKREREARKETTDAEADLRSLERNLTANTRRGIQVADAAFANSAMHREMQRELKRAEAEKGSLERRYVRSEETAQRERERADEWEVEAQRQNELKKAAHRDKRKANDEATKLLNQVKRLKGEGGSDMAKTMQSKLAPSVRARIEQAEADCDAALEELDEQERAAVTEITAAKEGSTVRTILDAIGKKGQHFNFRFIELAQNLSSRGMNASQVAGAMNAIIAFEAGSTKEAGEDYRLMDARRVREWREWMYPMMRFVALMAVKDCDEDHLIHDSTGRDGLDHFATVSKCVKGGNSKSVLLDISHPSDSRAETEFAAIESAKRTDVNGGVVTTFLNTRSSMNDNAANAQAVSDLIATKKMEQVKDATELPLDEVDKDMKEAVILYRNMTPAQREYMDKFYKTTCSGHGLHLEADVAQKDEVKAIEELKVIRLAAKIITRAMHREAYARMKARKRAKFEETQRRNTRLSSNRTEEKREPVEVFSIGGRGMALLKGWGEGRLSKGGKITGASPTKFGVWEVCMATSMMCSPSGDHSQYYLNESMPLEAYTKEQSLPKVKISPYMNSRQMIQVQLGAEIGPNINTITTYIHTCRIDEKDDPNALVCKVHYGLSDKFTVEAILARGMRYVVAFKVARYFNNHHAGRQNLRGVMDLLRALYVSWSQLTMENSTPPVPPLNVLSASVVAKYREFGTITPSPYHPRRLQRHPHPALAPRPHPSHPRSLSPPADWKEGYLAWYNHEEPAMSKIYEAATSQENWHGVAYHLAAGAPHMIETHDRNVDDDFSDVEGAKEMLVTSTEVERVFAVGNVVATQLDNGGTTVLARKGVTMAWYNGSFLTEAEEKKRQKAREAKSKSKGEDREKEESWIGMASYYALELPVRDDLLSWCRKNAKDTMEKEKRAVVAAGAAKLGRLKKKVDDAKLSSLNSALAYTRWQNHPLCRTGAELAALVATGTAAQRAEKYRDQIRARKAVYANMQGKLPAIGSGASAAEMTRLEAQVTAVVGLPLGHRKARPLPVSLRSFNDNATEHARKLDREHVNQIVVATQEFHSVVKAGVMRMKRPVSVAAESAQRRAVRAPLPLAPPPPPPLPLPLPPPPPPPPQEASEWNVLVMKYDEEVEQLVVYYHDGSTGFTHEELLEDLGRPGVERALVKDAVEWMKATPP